jgi:putative isomerase
MNPGVQLTGKNVKRIFIVAVVLFIPFIVYCQQTVNIDIRNTPFSYRGSYMALSSLKKEDVHDSVFIHDLSGSRLWKENHVLVIEPVKNIPYTVSADAASLKLSSTEGLVDVCFQSANILRIRSSMAFRITNGYNDLNSMLLPVDKNRFRYTTGLGPHYLITCIEGLIKGSGNRYLTRWDEKENRQISLLIEPDGSGNAQIAIEQYVLSDSKTEYNLAFDSCVTRTKKRFSDWSIPLMSSLNSKPESLNLAIYTLWSAFAEPRGLLKKEALLMSKNHMHGIWSWDHCFNALGLACVKAPEAWDQFTIMAGFQNTEGGLPDLVSDYYKVSCYTKPPVHGWFFSKLRQIPGLITTQKEKEAYIFLGKQATYWLSFSDDDHDGIPQYNHGFDSGWDNATSFDIGMPLESPDLTAYLIIQLDELCKLADSLGLTAEAASWQSKKRQLTDSFIAHSWNGSVFVSRRSGDHLTEANSKCLINYIPLLMGSLLPDTIRTKLLVSFLEAGFITPYGISSEVPSTAKYEADGYWRGPIWAPCTLFFTEALEMNGKPELAKNISAMYCNLCNRYGFSENFNTLTGHGQRCSAYTWTTSVYLYLSQKYEIGTGSRHSYEQIQNNQQLTH